MRTRLQTDFISKLGLTPDETRTIADINLKYAKRMDPVIKGPGGPFIKARKMRAISAEKESELQQVLRRVVYPLAADEGDGPSRAVCEVSISRSSPLETCLPHLVHPS